MIGTDSDLFELIQKMSSVLTDMFIDDIASTIVDSRTKAKATKEFI